MKSFRHMCAVAALMSAGLAGVAEAQLNPYGLGAGYPAANQYPSTHQAPASYEPIGYQTYVAQSGPMLSPANQLPREPVNTLTSLIGGPPVVTPVQPLPGGPQQPITPAPGPATTGDFMGGYSVGSGAGCSVGGGVGGYGGAGVGFDGGAACGYGYGYPPPGGGVAAGWFASFGGLIMTRDRGNHYFYSFERNNEANQLTTSRRADWNWGGGFDIRFGHYFNCGTCAVEAVYWGLFPESGSTVTTTDGIAELDTILNFDQLDYNGGAANLLTDDAQIHSLTRDNEFHNVELNLLQLLGGYGVGSYGPLNYRLLAGVRYFKFRDRLLFAADTVDRVLTGAPEEVYYDIDVDNNLIGFQIGGQGEFCATDRLTLDLGTKLGLFGNRIDHFSRIGGAAGTAVINNGPNLGRQFLVDNGKNDVAFLAEVNLGGRYCVTDCWTLTGGYRAVAITGVALPENQIYPDLRGIQDVELVDSNGSLILHGAYFGAEYNY